MTPLERMLQEIEAEARETARWTGRARFKPEVLAAMRAVRREAFIPEGERARAYANAPLGIGRGQTISQPFIVALMTDLLDLQRNHKVLEIGTGSGYQAAILAQLADQVWSIEVIPELSQRAAAALAAEGYRNVSLRVGQGAAGWPECAPFDAIIVTAAAASVPPTLIAQLRAPGRMVVPVGPRGEAQELIVIEKSSAGVVQRRPVLDVAFVPLTDG